MENPVLIFGAGATGRQALDIFQRNGVVVYGFLDDNKELHGTEIGTVSVLGDTDDGGFLKLIGPKCEAFVAIGERPVREQLAEMINERRKTMPVNAIHDTAVISGMASLGHGNFVGPRVLIGVSSRHYSVRCWPVEQWWGSCISSCRDIWVNGCNSRALAT